MAGKIAIVDYGMGNLRSVQKACARMGLDAVITSDSRDLEEADRIILPGVGAFPDAMENLRKTGLDTAIRKEVKKGKYLLGICLGMQLLCTRSFECGAKTPGFGFIKGDVVKFSPVGIKIPQIGWNTVEFKENSNIFSGLNSGMYFYFAHSFFAGCEDKYVLSATRYGNVYASGIHKDNVYGLQFHPEKSGDDGIKIFKNFSELK